MRTEFFQENQRVRHLKQLIAKNYFMQISESFFFLNGDLFMYFIFHLQTRNKQCLKSTAAFI